MFNAEKQIKSDFESAGGRGSLVADLLNLSAEVETLENHAGIDPEELTIDCRLRWHAGAFSFLTGSSDYDLDHRGYWGCSMVGMELSEEDARGIADDLLEQVIDNACESEVV